MAKSNSRLFTALSLFLSGLSGLLLMMAQTADAKSLLLVTGHYPPYVIQDPHDDKRGFDLEISLEIFSALGYETEVKFVPFARALLMTKMGEAVGIPTCAFRPERTDYIDYSKPLSVLNNGLYSRMSYDQPFPESLSELGEASVGTVKPYETYNYLVDLGLEPFGARDTRRAVLMLDAGRFDFLYMNGTATDYMIRNLGLKGKFRFQSYLKKDFHFCFSKKFPDSAAIRDGYDRLLAEMRESGRYDAIHDLYR